uniref:Uncharacterized protein n=1 Tax=Megaselia scalaris TaxID=36166 RepID=T1GFW5_MEGSC
MTKHYHEALRRGLPFPILTVAEYFSLSQEGFTWGMEYRQAGYFASILLWTSLASWMLMNLLLIAIWSIYESIYRCTTSLNNIGYYYLLPKRPLVIFLEGGTLEFSLGWCYWLLLVAGVLCFIVGVAISVMDLVWPHRFSTILEVYFDTPYDRHVILEESSDVRYRKRPTNKGLENPPGLGSRILRRLSSKATKETSLNNNGPNDGIENKGFQGDVPKSPWRYPFRRSQNMPQRNLRRTISQDSTSSIASASVQISPIHKQALSRMLPKTPHERIRDLDHW